jgi:hypothetical protein
LKRKTSLILAAKLIVTSFIAASEQLDKVFSG